MFKDITQQPEKQFFNTLSLAIRQSYILCLDSEHMSIFSPGMKYSDKSFREAICAVPFHLFFPVPLFSTSFDIKKVMYTLNDSRTH